MATFYRIYAFDKNGYKNKLKELEAQNKKITRVVLPNKTLNYYEIVYTDDFKKQAVADAKAKRKWYYESLFDRVFGSKRQNDRKE